MSTDAPIDVTAEEIPGDDHVPQSTAIVRRERRSEVIRPLNADQLAESFAEYQSLLPRLLDDSDYQDAGADGKFVKKSGWRKIATAFDLDVELVDEVVDRADDGRILRSKHTARATSPSGRVMEADGYCTVDEFTGRRASNPKIENDLRGTAATRAKNRAISDLVGMGEVSAEEVAAGSGQAAMPAWAQPAADDLAETTRKALGWLFGADLAGKVYGKLTADTDGELVGAVGRAVVMTISDYKKATEVPPTAEPEPAAAAEPVQAELGADAA